MCLSLPGRRHTPSPRLLHSQRTFSRPPLHKGPLTSATLWGSVLDNPTGRPSPHGRLVLCKVSPPPPPRTEVQQRSAVGLLAALKVVAAKTDTLVLVGPPDARRGALVVLGRARCALLAVAQGIVAKADALVDVGAALAGEDALVVDAGAADALRRVHRGGGGRHRQQQRQEEEDQELGGAGDGHGDGGPDGTAKEDGGRGGGGWGGVAGGGAGASSGVCGLLPDGRQTCGWWCRPQSSRSGGGRPLVAAPTLLGRCRSDRAASPRPPRVQGAQPPTRGRVPPLPPSRTGHATNTASPAVRTRPVASLHTRPTPTTGCTERGMQWKGPHAPGETREQIQPTLLPLQGRRLSKIPTTRQCRAPGEHRSRGEDTWHGNKGTTGARHVVGGTGLA
ncbi:hypothetical protein BU14_0548s0004 [Porphyra umbilicalis]|uniref:Uncharacterized protein n=1 Tax=Porphyra umbilicalis TaxID=2786 RepID=A0A1X6NRW4_PORUM|nr:hypothetical protein BU14_0548s0004 [Porphyra umbilicalis]|eukprot:OSX71354.1 hypothetical protein BU14_0548s0004 [Porphyra umbilicalis]